MKLDVRDLDTTKRGLVCHAVCACPFCHFSACIDLYLPAGMCFAGGSGFAFVKGQFS